MLSHLRPSPPASWGPGPRPVGVHRPVPAPRSRPASDGPKASAPVHVSSLIHSARSASDREWHPPFGIGSFCGVSGARELGCT